MLLDCLDVGHAAPMSPGERNKRFSIELMGEFGTWAEAIQAVDTAR